MSVQSPPTNIGTPVYNPTFFIDPASSSGITIPFLDANYLKFPTAQGSEDFTNGLFSTDTIDFNSATGANRAITNLSTSSFSDILGNATYTASIEENSTAIGIYDGGLVITSSNSINLVGADILLNGVPISSGVGDALLNGGTSLVPQTFTGYNQFNNELDINGNLIFQNSSSLIVLNSSLEFQNSLSPTYNMSLTNSISTDWTLASVGNPLNFNLSFGGMSITATAGFINLTDGYSVRVNNLLTTPNNPTIDTTNLGSGRGTFYVSSQLPYFDYNDGTSITTNPLVVSSTLSNYALLASPAFTGTPTAPTPTFPNSSTNIATTAFVSTNFVSLTANNTYTGTNAYFLGYTSIKNLNSWIQPTIPIGYSQYYSLNNLPYFQGSSTGAPSQQLATLANPNFAGIPTAPTATAGTNTSQLATTAFVQNAISSSTIEVVSILSSTGSDRSAVGLGTGTYWIFVPLASQPISSNLTPPYGYSFNYSVYTNFTGSPQTINSGDDLAVQGNFTTTIGTGAAQEFSQGGTNYWGYVLSAQIVTQGGLSDLYCDKNEPVIGNNFWYFFTASTDASLIGTTLTMNISVI